MKKLLAILLTLAVLCSVSVTALAADTDVQTFVYTDVAEDLAEIDEDGAFHQVGNYVIWLPSFFEEKELSEERVEQGYIANIEAADGSAAIIAFTDTNEEKADLDTLAAAYLGAGLDAEVVEVNGKPAMLYVDETSDTLNVLFLEEEDMETVISFYPLSDEGFNSLIPVALRTVQQGIMWSSVEPIAATVDAKGAVYPITGYDYAIWVPSVLNDTELSEEDIENGYVAYLTTNDESAAAWVARWDNEDGDTLESLKEYYTGEGAKDAELSIINGIPALTYSNEELDSAYVVFLPSEDEVVSVGFSPASDEGFGTVAMLMASSIQPVK